MNSRQQASRERLQRYLSLALAVVTSVLLVPPSWIRIAPDRDPPRQPEPRPIEIVRLPPETLPPPPPLPPPPKPRPERRPEPEPEPEPLPEPKLELRAEVPEIEIPRDRRDVRRVELRAESITTPRFEQQAPELDVPAERRERRRDVKVQVDAAQTPQLAQELPDANMPVPRAVPRDERRERIEVAQMTARSYHEADAPDVEVVTSRPAARPSRTPSPLPVSRQARTGVALRPAESAPDVEVPRGNTARPDRAAPLAVSGAYAGTRVTWDADPGDAGDVAVPTPRKSTRGAEAPALAVTSGGTTGLKYGAAPADAPIGPTGRARGRSGPARLEQVRAALARRYGLPLVSVQQLGQRSTEAARWNVLLPQISDLLRKARRSSRFGGVPSEEVVEVKRDGDRLIIRYRDGVVHVLVPGENGLAMLFVARAQGARQVTSKVEEGESARRALALLTRGGS